ncbi:cytochrome P450 [Pilatotrama ljubarskyi]|nr:cytochrome P450 [Pilatotrama ljubarskyi]
MHCGQRMLRARRAACTERLTASATESRCARRPTRLRLSSRPVQRPMLSLVLFLACVAGLLVLRIAWFSARLYLSPLRVLRGPSSPGFFYGHIHQACRAENSATTRGWVTTYRSNLFCRWLFMIPCLWTADPQAIRHVLHSSNYVKPWEASMSAARILGDSVLVAEGKKHKEQRAIMNPGFGPAQIRELVHIFLDKSAQLRDAWAEEIAAQGGCVKLDAYDGLKKMTLDVIGLAGFDYHLGALDAHGGKPNELYQAFAKIFAVVPPVSLFRILMDFFPSLDFFVRALTLLRLFSHGALRSPGPDMVEQPDERTRTINEARAVMRRIGSQLIREKRAEILAERAENGEGATAGKRSVRSRDLLTLLIRANMATDITDSQRLSDEEVLAQIPTFLVAGHETTSTAAVWSLYALTQQPRVQQKLREELLRLDTDSPSMDELASLPYLDCVVRETLRLHTPVTFTLRSPLEDDVIPVSEPFRDRDGKLRHEIRIASGNRIVISVLELHRSEAIWGADALEFRPERWENPPEAISNVPGVWGHILAFSGGPHACIGYRFSVVELKALLFTMLRAFEFELAADPDDVTTIGMFTQRPALKSVTAKGAQLPVLIRPYVHN